MSEETAFSTSDDDEVETGPPVAERNAAPHLAALGEKARDYARNARAENTQRAYDADWRHFSSWLRRQGFRTAARIRKRSGCISPPASTARTRQRSRRPSRRWSGGCRGFAGTIASSANHWTTRIDISRLCSPASDAPTADRPSRRKRSSPTNCSPCWRRSTMDLSGLRDRAILAIGFAGGLRRSEIAGLDRGPEQSEDGTGWIEVRAPKAAPC